MLPCLHPLPGPSSPAAAAASPSALPAPRSRAPPPCLASPRLTSALSARRPPRRPRTAHAGSWGGGRSARLPAGSRPPSCGPAPPGPRPATLCQFRPRRGGSDGAGDGDRGAGGGFGEGRSSGEEGAAIFVRGRGRVLALPRLGVAGLRTRHTYYHPHLKRKNNSGGYIVLRVCFFF